MKDNRIKSGISGFDNLIGEGFVTGSVNLISGHAGTGKSIFCEQVLYHNASIGNKCLYITFEQPVRDVKLQFKKFGWSYNKVKSTFDILSLDVDSNNFIDELKSILKKKYKVIAIDSLASLVGSEFSFDEKSQSLESIEDSVIPVQTKEESVVRKKVKKIVDIVRSCGSTTFLTSEISKDSEWLSRDTISEFLCDGVIVMHYLGVGSAHLRSMQIMKMRLTDHEKDFINFEISKNGFSIKIDETFKV